MLYKNQKKEKPKGGKEGEGKKKNGKEQSNSLQIVHTRSF